MYIRSYLFLLFSSCIFCQFNLLSATERLFFEKHPNSKANVLNKDTEALVNHIQKALDYSERYITKLPKEIMSFGGSMSSPRTRIFLNHICSLPETRYLEIGVYKGASTISALFNNPIKYAFAMDNFSEFGNVYDEFQKNLNKYIPQAPITFKNTNCFSVAPERLSKFNIYFYDGGHSTEDQKKAFTHFNPCFDDVFIAIVDDWMWDQVREGTFAAFEELKYEILFEKEVALRFKQDVPWRYLYVCLIKKTK